MKVESLTGYLMSEDRKIAEIENGKILKFDSALLPLYLKRTEDIAGWLAGRAIDTHRVNSRLLKKVFRLHTADDAEIALSVNGATITDTYWICSANHLVHYADVCFKENDFDGLALYGDPDSFSQRPSRTPELTNIGSYEKCWRRKDGAWWMYKAGTPWEYFSELFICRLGLEMGFSMAWYEMEEGYIRTKDFTGGAKMNFQRAGSPHPLAVVRAGKRSIQQLDTVEIRGIGNAVDFRRHCLIFGRNDQPLRGIVRSSRGLLGQFLHADQFFVNDRQRAVRHLDHGNRIVGVADALVEGGHVRAHQFADRQTSRVVCRGIDPQTGRQALHGLREPIVMRSQRAGRVPGHEIGMDRDRHHAPSFRSAKCVGRSA